MKYAVNAVSFGRTGGRWNDHIMDENIDIERPQRSKICRTCLVESTSVSLFAVEEKTGEFYSDMLMFCASIQVWEDDGLPGKVCEKCAQNIAQMFSFKNLCEKSDKLLRKVSVRVKTNVYFDSDEEGEEEEVEEKVNWSETKIFCSDSSTEQKKIDEESNGQLNEVVENTAKNFSEELITNCDSAVCKKEIDTDALNNDQEMQNNEGTHEIQNSIDTEVQNCITENSAKVQKEREEEIHNALTNCEAQENTNAISSIQEDQTSHEETNYDDSRTSNNEDAGLSNNEDTRSSNNEDTRFSNNEDSRLSTYSKNSSTNNYEKTNNHTKKRKHIDYVETHNRQINYEDLGIHHFDDTENHENIQNYGNTEHSIVENYHNPQNYDASTSNIQNYVYNNPKQKSPELPTYEDAVAMLTYEREAPVQHYQSANVDYEATQTFIDISEVHSIQQGPPIQNTQNNPIISQNVNSNSAFLEQNVPETQLRRLLTDKTAISKSSQSHNAPTFRAPTESQIMFALLNNPVPSVNNAQTSGTQSSSTKAMRKFILSKTPQATVIPQNAHTLSSKQSVPNSFAPVSYGVTPSTFTFTEEMYHKPDNAVTNNLTKEVLQGQNKSAVQTPIESIEIEDDDDNSIDLTKDDASSKSQPLLLSMLQSAPSIYKCHLCQDKFSNINMLKYHKQTVHGNVAATFKITVLDNVEINTPSPKRQRVQCTLCKDSLCIHQLLTDTPESFQCNICGKLFENSQLLKQHLTTHKPQRTPNSSTPYKPQAFVAPHGRNRVILPKQDLQNTFTKCAITNQLEGYRCVICGFTCTDDASCKNHIQYHFKDIVRLENKSFKCMACNEFCNTDDELLEHVKAHSLCVCFICGKKVMNRTGLTRHYTMHINENCKRCGQKFQRDVESHSCNRDFQCDCGKAFTTKYWYDIHRKVHHNSMFGCEKCDFKCYSNKTLVQHKLKHVAQYDFCDVTL